MINVLDSVKTLYKSDSVMKKYFVVFRDATTKRTDENNIVHTDRVMLDNSQIMTESLSITESICSSGYFQVGLCESANMRITVVMPDNVKGDEVCIFQVLGEYDPVISSDDTKGLQISEENTVELESTFTSTNIISGLDSNTFDKEKNYLILAKLKYIGNAIYLYVESSAGNSRMVYYLKPGLFKFSNLEVWDNTKTYMENQIVLHDDYVWKSRTTNNTTEPGSLVDGEPTNAWENITQYVQVAIPIIGNDFYEYKIGVYANTQPEYGTLVGAATIYELPVPIMPLGLFAIYSCKRQNDSNLRDLEGYDRMQDVGLNVDVYLPNDGSTIIPFTSEIQLGRILDAAAEGTQIVIGNNLSKESVNLIQLDNEQLPFPDFPQDDETTPDTDEGIIYKVTKSESQTVSGDKYDSSSVKGDYHTTLYITQRGTVIDSDNSNWSTYANSGQLRIKGTRRQTRTITESRQWQRSGYYEYYFSGWIEYPNHESAEVFGADFGQREPHVGDSYGGGTITEIWDLWSEPRWTSSWPRSAFVYQQGSYYSINGKSYYCYKVSESAVHWDDDESAYGSQTSTAYLRYDTQYGYYYPWIDAQRGWVQQNWTVATSEYYPSAMNIPNANNFYDVNGNPIKQYAYIDCTYVYYWKYDVDLEFINQLLAERWVYDHEVGSARSEWWTIAERQGQKYENQNANKIFSQSEAWNSMTQTYVREAIYVWKEQADLYVTPYIVPQETYDDTLSYTVYITYPSDMLAYQEENKAYLLAMDEVNEYTSQDGTYHSQGVLNINRQADVRAAILDNSSKQCKVVPGTYVLDNVTYSGGRFNVYWVQTLEYTCYVSYNGGAFQEDGEKSKIVRSANPFISCVSHSQAEKFNSENVTWQSETVHGKRRDIIKGFMELHGLFINFDRWGVSTIRNVQASTLYPSEDLYPHDSKIPGNEAYGDIYPSVGSMEVTDISICKSIYIDDDLNNEFDGVLISKSQATAAEAGVYPYYYNKLTRRYGAVPSGMPEIAHEPWEGNKYYVIEDNFFIDNFVFDTDLLKAICQQILSNVGDLQYFNLNAELRCLPYLEVGDNINIMTPQNGYETAILRRVMKGNMAQMDSIETDFYD